MIPTLIGISSGILLIILLSIFGKLDKKTICGLLLCAIGVLYVGFVWEDIRAVGINIMQAILFLFVAYWGIKKNPYILAIGYFLHGIWDLFYHSFQNSALIPPHYELFCFSVDFTIGIYVVIVFSKNNKRHPATSYKLT